MERESRPKLIDIDPSQKVGLSSVTLACRDCDFTVSGDIKIVDGWKAVREQIIVDCQRHHSGKGMFAHEHKNPKFHNGFKILSGSDDVIGGISVSGETRAQVHVFESAAPFLHELGES